MKQYLFIISFLFFAGHASAQTGADKLAPYQKDNRIPTFNILLPDSTYFTPDQLPQYQYTAIIYFSPDCGHCQHMAKDMVKKMDSLKNTFFVLVAYKSLEDIKGFGSYYGLDKFSNIRMGRDPNYFIPAFYRVEATPFVAIYNQNKLLVKVFDPPHNPVMEVPDLIGFVNKH